MCFWVVDQPGPPSFLSQLVASQPCLPSILIQLDISARVSSTPETEGLVSRGEIHIHDVGLHSRNNNNNPAGEHRLFGGAFLTVAFTFGIKEGFQAFILILAEGIDCGRGFFRRTAQATQDGAAHMQA